MASLADYLRIIGLWGWTPAALVAALLMVFFTYCGRLKNAPGPRVRDHGHGDGPLLPARGGGRNNVIRPLLDAMIGKIFPWAGIAIPISVRTRLSDITKFLVTPFWGHDGIVDRISGVQAKQLVLLQAEFLLPVELRQHVIARLLAFGPDLFTRWQLPHLWQNILDGMNTQIQGDLRLWKIVESRAFIQDAPR